MAEAPPIAAPIETPPQPPEKQFVGMYDTEEQFESGLRSLAEKVDYPLADGPLLGVDGMWDKPAAERAYKTLRRLVSKQEDEPPETTPTETPPEPPAKPADTLTGLEVPDPATTPAGEQTIASILARANITEEDIASHWRESGHLSDDQYQKLGAIGYPRDMVNSFMQGQQIQRETVMQQAYDIAGGEAQLGILMGWAGQNYDQAARERINAAVQDHATLLSAVKEIAFDYNKAGGSTGARDIVTSGGTAPPQGAITNRTEYVEVSKAARNGNEQAQQRLRGHLSNGGTRFIR